MYLELFFIRLISRHFCLHSAKKQIAGENILNLFQLVLADLNFALDYNKLHPVEDDVETITQVVPKL